MSEPNGENNPIYIFFLVTPKMEILDNVKTYKKIQKCKMVRRFGHPLKTLKFQRLRVRTCDSDNVRTVRTDENL